MVPRAKYRDHLSAHRAQTLAATNWRCCRLQVRWAVVDKQNTTADFAGTTTGFATRGEGSCEFWSDLGRHLLAKAGFCRPLPGRVSVVRHRICPAVGATSASHRLAPPRLFPLTATWLN